MIVHLSLILAVVAVVVLMGAVRRRRGPARTRDDAMLSTPWLAVVLASWLLAWAIAADSGSGVLMWVVLGLAVAGTSLAFWAPRRASLDQLLASPGEDIPDQACPTCHGWHSVRELCPDFPEDPERIRP